MVRFFVLLLFTVFGLIEPFVLARSLRVFRTSGLGLGEDSDPSSGPRGGGAREKRQFRRSEYILENHTFEFLLTKPLAYVKSNSRNLPGAITVLEARDLPLMKDIRTSISPSSAVGLNTTSALANYATEAEFGTTINTTMSMNAKSENPRNTLAMCVDCGTEARRSVSVRASGTTHAKQGIATTLCDTVCKYLQYSHLAPHVQGFPPHHIHNFPTIRVRPDCQACERASERASDWVAKLASARASERALARALARSRAQSGRTLSPSFLIDAGYGPFPVTKWTRPRDGYFSHCTTRTTVAQSYPEHGSHFEHLQSKGSPTTISSCQKSLGQQI
uniref:Uncharacterized protein n=1 Tax=Timema cristinae TaxID=61476 RepID=A0A7R9CRW0_TIMCR|nr:unnamed protein product [Timema cristinae]